ncbi:PAS domain-containing sensor histidine kinase [Roseospira navarrensis]|uniref:histidine kinase n=1 Tax=Roseospira navarrensis TaxID=140058 RepID=A0A7X2D607_9PROT|nr:PAS domain-containing sensor histidine kinase [Roseospira navarrensis]MQX37810.1 PAS domain-containing protein [Roseospira navarrensis]
MTNDFVDPRTRLPRPGAPTPTERRQAGPPPEGATVAEAGALSPERIATLSPLLEQMGRLVGGVALVVDRQGRPLGPAPESVAERDARHAILADLARHLEAQDDTTLRSASGGLMAWGTRLSADGVHLANLMLLALPDAPRPLGEDHAGAVLPMIRATSKEIARRLLAEIQARDARNMVTRLLTRGTTEALAAESRLMRMAAQVPGVLYQFRLWPDGRMAFPYATEGIRDIYGVAPAAVRDDALPAAAVIHPDDIDRVMESILRSARTLTLWHEQYRVNHPTRGLIHVEGRSQPEPLPDGSVLWHGLILDVTDRVLKDEALLASKREKALILESISDVVAYFTGPDMRMVWSNVRPTQVSAPTVQDWPDNTCHRRWFDSDVPCDGCPVIETFRTGQPARADHTTPDGRHWALGASPVRDGDGTLVGVVEVAREITDQVTAKRALDLAVADLKRAQRIARVGNWLFDPAVGVPEWSEEVYRLYECDPAQPPPALADFGRFYGGADLERFRAAISGAVRDGKPYDITLRLTLPDRAPKWVRAIGEPDPEPGPAGHVVRGTIQDITQVRAAEDALVRSEETLRLALEVAEDGVWDLDARTGTVEWNARYYAMLGLSPDIFRATPDAWMGLIHPEDWPRVEAAAEAAMQNGRQFNIEYRMRRADGAWIWVWDQGRPVARDADGAVTRMIGLVTDIDARKRRELSAIEAQVSAEQATQEKSRFMAAMSHELRTPLNAILGFSEMMKEEMLGRIGHQSYRQYAADIHASGAHLAKLIDGLMDLAKIEAGRRDLTLERVQVPAVAQAALHLVEQTAARAGLTLESDLDPTLPPVIADDLAVRQILFNLLTNAIKYTPRGGRVTLSARAYGGGGVAIAVADTGIGIADADRNRLFHPFARGTSAEHSRIEGSGLGLALVKSLVDLHGGTLSLESTPGQGSVFTVRLPPRRSAPGLG